VSFLLARQLARLPAPGSFIKTARTCFNKPTTGALDRVDAAAAERGDKLLVSPVEPFAANSRRRAGLDEKNACRA